MQCRYQYGPKKATCREKLENCLETIEGSIRAEMVTLEKATIRFYRGNGKNNFIAVPLKIYYLKSFYEGSYSEGKILII